MARWCTFAAMMVGGTLFGWCVQIMRLYEAFQPMVTALSIMVAAVFVRLNRGMPSLEWKSATPKDRTELTSRIVALTKEYASIIAINAVTLIGLVTLVVVGKENIGLWPEWAKRLTAAAIGSAGALCLARMTYVVWRDIDIVTLQKRLIDGAAARETIEIETKSADDKVAQIRAAGLRKVDIPPPKAWGE